MSEPRASRAFDEWLVARLARLARLIANPVLDRHFDVLPLDKHDEKGWG